MLSIFKLLILRTSNIIIYYLLFLKVKIKEKIIRFLISRGYNYEVAKDAVKEMLESIM